MEARILLVSTEVAMVEAEVTRGRGLGLSALAPRVVQSEIRAMTMESDRVGGVNLAQGVCDTEVPSVVAEAAKAAIDEGHNIYTRMDGISRLRRAIAEKTERLQSIVVDPEREVVVTSGATGAFHAVALALFDPGDEVLLFEPFYGYHVGTLRSLRVVPVAVELDAAANWALDLDRVRAAITPKTRAIVVNTPSNPAGKVFTRAELEGLAEIAKEHDLFVLTDEIYEHFIYGEAKHISPAAIDGMRERTIIMSGYSKTFSVTGWRIGYVIADARWIGAIAYFSDLLYVCAPSPFQHGVAAGIEKLGRTFYAGLAMEHEVKREMIVSALRDAGFDPYVPDGAYYILASTAGLGDVLEGENAAQRARSLLTKTGVAAVAGSAFFRAGKGEDLLRFCFAKKDEDLEEACRRLRSLR
jgi:aminotransferase